MNLEFCLELTDVFPPQVGGLRLAVHPTWMAFITQPRPAWSATMASSGTTGRVRIWWLPRPPWWCARQTSDRLLTHGVNATSDEFVEQYPENWIFSRRFQFSEHLERAQTRLPGDMCRLPGEDCGFRGESFTPEYLLTKVPGLYFNKHCSARDEGDRRFELLLRIKTHLIKSNYALTYDPKLN